jgi:hypothetical protein
MSEPTRIRVKKGDRTSHDGPGWYYWDEEYPEEGACGAFPTKEAAVNHAKEGLGEVEILG